MRCEEVTENLTGYLAGEAGPLKVPIESHIAACSRCRSELESLGVLWNKLGSLPTAEPGPGMRMRFQTMLEAYEAGLDLSTPRTPRSGWLKAIFRPAPAFQFAYAAVLLIIGGLAGHFLFQEKSRSTEIVQLRDEVHSMRELVTISLLQQESAAERLQGVSWSRLVRQPDEKVLDALVNALNRDSSVDVRLAAVDALYRYSDRPVVRQELMWSLLKQESPLVQIALIDVMVGLREKQSADALRQLSGDENTNRAVRNRARWGLQQLS